MAAPGDVNDFRGEMERRYPADRMGRIQRLFGQSVPGQQDLGVPDYNEYSQRREAQQGLLDRARRLFGMSGNVPAVGGGGSPPVPPSAGNVAVPPGEPSGQPGGRTYYSNVPSTRVRPPIDISALPRGGMAPSALGRFGGLPLALTLLQATQDRRDNPPVYDAQGNYIGRMNELYQDVAREGAAGQGSLSAEAERGAGQIGGESGTPMESRGRDTGQRQGPQRPQQRRSAPQRQQTIDPRFAQLLSQILAAEQQQAAPAPQAPAPRPGPGLNLDPMMGGGNA